MKKFVWTLGGVCAAAAGLLVLGSRRFGGFHDLSSSERLAHELEEAWADSHTTVDV